MPGRYTARLARLRLHETAGPPFGETVPEANEDEEIDELFGLKMGADDFIRKPFSQRPRAKRASNPAMSHDCFRKVH